ncbi:MAG: LysM peptidoglycan-binding domain-containing protein [Anaerotruncus sp.]|nr:MAG: LysM peptidoglycan-binding domain-containing protein [Anaerotruncus sp.]
MKPLLGFGTAAQEICYDAAVIKKYPAGFTGTRARRRLKGFMPCKAKKHAGALLLPGGDYFNAFFTSFEATRNAAENYISYSAQFTESQTGKSASLVCKSTVALENENAFEIAARCGVSVEKIMRLNCFKTPFDVPLGTRVIIN